MDKKVYIILHTLSIGGAERHASSIANYLSKHGYPVRIVLLDDHNVEYQLSSNVEVISLSDSGLFGECEDSKPNILDSIRLKIFSFASDKKYEYLDKLIFFKNHYVKKLNHFFEQQSGMENSIVISFMPIPNICSSMAKERINYKLILGEFSSPHLEFAPDAPENKMKRKYFPNADGFVFQTDEQKSFYTFLPNVKKEVIPNPIEDIKTQPFSGTRRKEIVNYCRLVKVKNIPLLISAFAKLSVDYPDYSLKVYGDGPEKLSLIKLIAELGLESKVKIEPFKKNVLELVKDSAMFVTSSDREGISNSMLEAMAIGLPTISTDCPAGGARMFIEPYKNGIIVPVNNTEALYKAMKYMIDNPAEAEKMGQNAVSIRKVLEKNKILNQWHQFIKNI